MGSSAVREINHKGFTLLELLIVIVVIGILAGLVITGFRGIQEKAKVSSAKEELARVQTAVELLSVDTGKLPNGCPRYGNNDPEVEIEQENAGLTTIPQVGVTGAGCEWEALDIVGWKGPYLAKDAALDPWGHSYNFDPDYYLKPECNNGAPERHFAAVQSNGKDEEFYTCDDVYRIIFEE